MKAITEWLESVKKFLEIPIFKLKDSDLTLWTLLYFIFLVFLLFYLTKKLKIWVIDRLLARFNIDVGVREAIGTIVRYFVIAIGLVVILQTAGIDLTTLNVLAGAIGLGLGFGLQNIVSNFISGIIILFERPIKIGDRIEVGNVEGAVVKINSRSTTVVTNDNISIIVPNSKFISENVVNWSHDDRKVRFKVPVSVAGDSDVRLVEKLLLEVATENSDVLEKPAPGVRFLKFGDNAFEFELRAWSTTLLHRKGMLISALNFAIHDKFRENGIEISSPRRDLYILGGKLGVTLHGGDSEE